MDIWSQAPFHEAILSLAHVFCAEWNTRVINFRTFQVYITLGKLQSVLFIHLLASQGSAWTNYSIRKCYVRSVKPPKFVIYVLLYNICMPKIVYQYSRCRLKSSSWIEKLSEILNRSVTFIWTSLYLEMINMASWYFIALQFTAYRSFPIFK